MSKLEPTEAQRKALVDKLSEHVQWHRDGVEMAVDEMIAAANSIPDGAPVGTIARRPDGAFVAVRVLAEDLEQYWTYTCVDHSGPDDDWPDRRDADSWPVIYDPREYEGTEYDPETGLHWFKPGEEPLVPRPDPTAQQEPGESLARGLDDLAAGRVSRRDDYLEPEQEPATTHPVSPESTNCVPKPRTPRVVDRLGVDEQGSRWLDANGKQWSWSPYLERWRYFRHVENGSVWVLGDQDLHGPFREILEPHVLPSLDCEEARDGTVWEARYVLLAGRREQTPGWKFQHTQDGWVYEDGSRVLSPEFLTGRGPYTEVLGDPS